MKKVLLFLPLLGVIVWLLATSLTVAPETDRVAELRGQIAETTKEMERLVEAYYPTTGPIADLGVLSKELLPHRPSVVEVTATPGPKKRLVHLLDWHFVPKDLFALDQETARGRKRSAAEIDHLFEERQCCGPSDPWVLTAVEYGQPIVSD